MLESFTLDEIYHDMKSEIDRKHDGLISLMIELISEAEIDETNAVVPVEIYHLLSERLLDYVRLIEFSTGTE